MPSYLLTSSLDTLLQLASELSSTGTISLRQPRITDWAATGYGSNTVEVDVADLFGGAGYVAPVNINVGGGTCEFALYKKSANLPFRIEGWGATFGVSAGWSALPAITGSSNTLMNKAAKQAIGNAGKQGGGALSGVAKMPNGGIGPLIAGPKAPSVLAPKDFEGYATLIGGDINFGANGAHLGIVVFAERPVDGPADLILAKAIGLVWNIHLTLGTVDAGVNYAVFKTRANMGGLPCGAYQGMSIAR